MAPSLPIAGHVSGLLHPAGYHGGSRRKGHFEGWYVKMVSADRTARVAVIPGVFLAQEEDGPHEAFVQILDGSSGKSWYVPFPIEQFHAAPDKFEVRVGSNTFSEFGVRSARRHDVAAKRREGQGLACGRPSMPALPPEMCTTAAVEPRRAWHDQSPCFECLPGAI